MPLQLIPSFLFFCFVQSITPGPANLASLAVALNEGREAALRQWRGIFVGFTIVSLSSGLITFFLGNILGEAVGVLSWVGSAYLLYLAWHLISPLLSTKKASREEATVPSTRKTGFFSGLFVQLTNVKIMVYCMTVLSSFVLPYTNSFLSLLLMGLFLPFTGPMCNLVWLFAGVRLQGIFEKHRVVINILMALSLVYCAVRLHL